MIKFVKKSELDEINICIWILCFLKYESWFKVEKKMVKAHVYLLENKQTHMFAHHLEKKNVILVLNLK